MATPADVVFEAVALVNEWHEQAQAPPDPERMGRGGLRDLTADPED